MTALHNPHLHDERAASIHDLRFGRPPSKNYASEPDLRGPTPTPITPPQTQHTIISQSPTKGRIKSKKKYKAPAAPVENVMDTHSLPRGAERAHSVSDIAMQDHWSQWPGSSSRPRDSPYEAQKSKPRKMGLFRKKNESRRPVPGEDQRSSSEEQDRLRAVSEERQSAVSRSPRRSPREEIRERARSLDCLQHELSHPPVSPGRPVAATSLTHLHHPQEPRMWSTLERDSRRRSSSREIETRRSSTLERDSRKNSAIERESRRSSTLERDHQKSHRRMSTLERKLEERKQWAGEASTPLSGRMATRLDSYRENASHRRSSSSGSHHELIKEEVENREIKDEWDRAEAEMKKKNSSTKVDDEWDKAEREVMQRKKMSASLQAELISTVKNLKKSSEPEVTVSTLTRKNKEPEKRPSGPSSRNTAAAADHNTSQPKTFFFGMEPEVQRDTRGETNTGLHKIKNQEEMAKIKNQEEAAKTKNQDEVRITGQTVEFSRRTLERAEKSRSRSRSARKESHKATVDETDAGTKHQSHADRRKLSRDVEEFAIAIERHKMSRTDGESRTSGSSRREDGGYHSRQNSGSLYLDNEHDQMEGEVSINLRPTLPRRQYEIPRFSPNAAWRSLSLERASRQKEPLNESRSSEDPDSVYETKIQRYTRPTAPPRGSGEKSADSGISGDAGSPGPTHEFEPLSPPEKTKSSSGPLAVSSPVASGRQEVRRAWTPAQDLDDNSLDGSGEQPGLPQGLSTPPKLTSRSNMFGKSPEITTEPETEPDSPVETEVILELIMSEKKDNWPKWKKRPVGDNIPQKFNSLRKLKRSVSGAIVALGRKSPGGEDSLQRSRSPEDPHTQPLGDDATWRDNWSMSRSIPNSLNTCEEQDSVSNLSGSRAARSRSESRIGGNGAPDVPYDETRSRTPSYLQHGGAGHIMYLPEYNSRKVLRGDSGNEDENERHYDHHNIRPLSPDNERKPPSGDEDPALPPESYHGPSSLPVNIPDSHPHLKKSKGKKFSYQSTVRILEKRKLEEKLAREVAEKERLRLKEMEAMKKVEEEFQKKREREKKKLKQQLKLFHMQQQQQQPQKPQHSHNNSYSSDDHPPSSYSSDQQEVSSQDSSRPPPPRSSPPQQSYGSPFSSLPPELPAESSPGLLSGIKSWVKGRRESRSSSTSTTTTLTSAPRQEPDGAPASSPRKTSDDYSGSSAASSRKNSEDLKANPREEFRAEIIAASRKRSGDTRLGGVVGGGRESPSRPKHSGGGRKSVYNHLNEVAERESQRYKYYHPQEEGLQQHHGRHHHREGSRRSQSPESRRLTQELPEFHQERREYREYRGSSRHSHSPPGRIPSSPAVSVTPTDSNRSSNYRRDFCRGNAHVIGPNVVSVKMKRHDESDRFSKHSSDDRRSVGSSGVHRSASVDLLETGSSSSSSSTARHHQSSHHLADTSLSHNYTRMNGYPPVDSSPARFAHSMLTPFNASKGYRPVSFSPPPPTKILPVN